MRTMSRGNMGRRLRRAATPAPQSPRIARPLGLAPVAADRLGADPPPRAGSRLDGELAAATLEHLGVVDRPVLVDLHDVAGPDGRNSHAGQHAMGARAGEVEFS